ncbi:hypothetical protein SULYE_0164 [Sulfurihydrogenibium yellowstonense SS-5]|uniref:Uncharacterized protein n=1 Tax=Sulfurihydrogenibium yellowstonense SS-5 TaxID=432331 RepID=C4FHY5_9AQUI|nr:hypothetical protein SULYE_0164 [Sulfurihydrogenibium yellowstonense SS-5]
MLTILISYLSNPHGSDGTEYNFIKINYTLSFLTHTVQMELFFLFASAKVFSLSNPHGSDGTHTVDRVLVPYKKLSNPHGSDGTPLNLSDFIPAKNFLTHTVQMEPSNFIYLSISSEPFLTHTVQMELNNSCSITPSRKTF